MNKFLTVALLVVSFGLLLMSSVALTTHGLLTEARAELVGARARIQKMDTEYFKELDYWRNRVEQGYGSTNRVPITIEFKCPCRGCDDGFLFRKQS